MLKLFYLYVDWCLVKKKLYSVIRFYSLMVIRDLILRSVVSFGSFYLIRFLYDEYMFYLVEYKVVVVIGEILIVVMGEVR